MPACLGPLFPRKQEGGDAREGDERAAKKRREMDSRAKKAIVCDDRRITGNRVSRTSSLLDATKGGKEREKDERRRGVRHVNM